jgi:MYXO-CTERM domain-containing protein
VRRRLWLAALIGCGLSAASARAAEVETLRQAGPPEKRFNIAVLGDGYRVEDQALLSQNAKAIIDYVLNVTPLKQYAQFFNVKLVHVISKDNGADNGSYGALRDTALDAYFNCDDIDRLLCIDDGKAFTAAAQAVPEYNFAIVLVNDPKYGGSGGAVCACSSNEQSFEVLAHEIGHSLALLADEYSDDGNQPACDPQQDCPEANVTLRTTLSELKWKDWVETGTPLPTPATAQYLDATGLFEGARYTPTGVYRPRQDCKMRDLGAEYCPVCTEQFVRSIWSATNIAMVEATTPSQQSLQITGCDAIDLSVTSPPILPSTYHYAWSVDGRALPATANSVQLLPSVLKQGHHDVQVAIEDTTAFVRSDPYDLLQDGFSWSVSVTRDDCEPIGSGGTAGTAGAAGAGASGAAGAGAGGSAGDPPGGGASGAAAGGTGGAITDVGGNAGSAAAGAGASAGAAVSGAASGGAGVGGASGSAGLGENGGTSAGTAPAPAPTSRDSSGCGCSVPSSSQRGALSLGALAVAGVLARRRRRV